MNFYCKRFRDLILILKYFLCCLSKNYYEYEIIISDVKLEEKTPQRRWSFTNKND